MNPEEPEQVDPDEPRQRRSWRVSNELRPYVDRADADLVDETAERIGSARAIPRPAFRSELRSRLQGLEGAGGRVWRPRHLKATVAVCATSGVGLLLVAAVGVAGSGPLGF